MVRGLVPVPVGTRLHRKSGDVLWLPPFIGVGVEDTYGVVCFHVKQSNNGTLWFASKYALPFETLEPHS